MPIKGGLLIGGNCLFPSEFIDSKFAQSFITLLPVAGNTQNIGGVIYFSVNNLDLIFHGTQ